MITAILGLAAICLTPTDYRSDLDSLESTLKDYGAYVASDGIDLKVLDKAYRPRFGSVKSRGQLMTLLEDFVGELHDFHASLGTNNQASPRLVPSGTDLIGTWDGSRAIVEQVRQNSLAERAKIEAEDEILTINGLTAREAAATWFRVGARTARGWDWALNSALAGRWDHHRLLTIRHRNLTRQVDLATADHPKLSNRLTFDERTGGLIYLRPEDSLGNDDLIGDLDRLLPRLRSATKVVLDLRNTPSGGSTTVARGIMGLFISKRMPYQWHMVEERATKTVRDWVEYATPRSPNPISCPLMVLVGKWTGSMGEGLAIGFDAMGRGTVIGTRMAGLRGAVDSVDLPVSKIRVFFPTEKLFHVNGTPRHEWVPKVLVKPGPGDPWLEAAERR